MTSPFDQYEKVDVYVVDVLNSTRAFLLQKNVDLNIGMMAARLDTPLFPDDTPLNRSCRIAMTGAGNTLDGTHEMLNSKPFYMIRTKQSINGTLVIAPIPTTTTSSVTTSIISTTTTSSSSSTSNASETTSESGFPTNPPTSPYKFNSMSPLVIGLISAGCVALMIAIIAICLLFRARRRPNRNTDHFKSLRDQPSSPTDDASKRSLFKPEISHDLAFVGPIMGTATTTGRISSGTGCSAEPMIKGANMLGYNNQSPVSPTASMPLVERNSPSVPRIPQSDVEAPNATGDVEEAVRPQQGSALSTGDAQLIAETFWKTMRRPRWDEDADDDEDEIRRMANQLLRKELSEQGLDMQRGVQRRVTIQDRSHENRESIPTPISETVSIK
ncbi:hypothetical protein BGZ65_006406 [Modicella reniformis]|uniref:Uncharacterized protein n=1 Tax=Modicella reniformis TaxID=1440133 RepID=A0A9P6SSR6_9FUNG|nr:hypothetical protein BGZ65_006406 [Modicella reniformis]